MKTKSSITKQGNKSCGNCVIHNGCIHTQHAYEAPSCWEEKTAAAFLLNQNIKQLPRFLNHVTIHATHLPVHS